MPKIDMARSAKTKIPFEKDLPESLREEVGGKRRSIGLERAEAEHDRPIAKQHGDNSPPCDGKTGLQYKFQRSSATVTYSRS